MMSFPSPSPANSPPPAEVHDDEAAEARHPSLPTRMILGLLRLLGVALLVYLTYFFTITFANRQPAAAPLTEEQKDLARKAEDLRAKGKTLLTSYGWVNPATKSVRIPIDRAMELLAAEAAQPAAPQAAPRPSSPGPAAPGTATTATPSSALHAIARRTRRRGGTGAERTAGSRRHASRADVSLVCMACHDADGKGKIVRLAMPAIPDLTDPKWQASRTDAELTHSILEGKESLVNGVKLPLMLPMKDKLGLAHTDVKDMVAYMRKFKDGKQVVSATPGGTPEQVTVTPAVPVPPSLTPTPAPPSLMPSTYTHRVGDDCSEPGGSASSCRAPGESDRRVRGPNAEHGPSPGRRHCATRTSPLATAAGDRDGLDEHRGAGGAASCGRLDSTTRFASLATDRMDAARSSGRRCRRSPTSRRTTGTRPRATASSPPASSRARGP